MRAVAVGVDGMAWGLFRLGAQMVSRLESVRRGTVVVMDKAMLGINQRREEPRGPPRRRRTDPPGGSDGEAAQVPEETIAEDRGTLRCLFDSMDKNHDCTVNRREMIIATRKDPHLAERLGLPGKFRQGSEGHSLFESIFQAMDRDCSDEVSWHEFESHMRNHAEATTAAAVVRGEEPTAAAAVDLQELAASDCQGGVTAADAVPRDSETCDIWRAFV